MLVIFCSQACDFMEVSITNCSCVISLALLTSLTCCCLAAKHVMACDFMEVSIAENRRQHEALGNVSFMVADVTQLEQVSRMYYTTCHVFCYVVIQHPTGGGSTRPWATCYYA
jgi:predicted RNA methylase